MTFSDLASLGSFVSGLAVLVSLVFLWFQLRQIGAQIRQSEKNQRAPMSQGAVNRSIETNTWLTQPHISAVFQKVANGNDLDEQEALLLTGISRNILLNFQDAHVQHQMGLADDITLEHAAGSMRFFLSLPALRATYLLNRGNHAPALIALTDRIVADVPLRTPYFFAEQLRSALAEVQAGASGN
jgi:hypothetical protein